MVTYDPNKKAKIKYIMKKHFMKKYGVENPFQAHECKEKMKQTCQEKYGVDYAMQSHVVSSGMNKSSQIVAIDEKRLIKKDKFLSKYIIKI